LVEEPRLRFIDGFASTFAMAQAAIEKGSLAALVQSRLSTQSLDYDAVHAGKSDWKILPSIDHPAEPSKCLVSGTGLTHLGSARDRQAMHLGADENAMTDSMKMFRWGVQQGKPQPGQIGISPEWFYKGNGTILRACGQPLDFPSHAEDGGEEAEIAGIYFISPDGQPIRIGMTIGNEFSDHRFEKRNYLNLASSKLRTCSIGPELVIDPAFASVPGQVAIERDGKPAWSKSIRTGEEEMCHSLANIEHHHFKFAQHRIPGDVHVHYFGAHSLSFGDSFELRDGDMMKIQFEGFGRALHNPLRKANIADKLVEVRPLR
jgi:hypothetical protein